MPGEEDDEDSDTSEDLDESGLAEGSGSGSAAPADFKDMFTLIQGQHTSGSMPLHCNGALVRSGAAILEDMQ